MWAGQRNVLIGDLVVGVGWDDDVTAAALAGACAEWPAADEAESVPVALGVRSVPVGLLRRRTWLVHYGIPLRHRADDVAAAAAFVHGALARLAREPGDSEVVLACRAFVKSAQAVLVHVPDEVDVDERPLHKRGIEQLPALSTIVRPASRAVIEPERSYALTGAVIDRQLLAEPASLDDARRHLLSIAGTQRPQWGSAIDGLGDRILVTRDVGAAIRRLLG